MFGFMPFLIKLKNSCARLLRDYGPIEYKIYMVDESL